MGCKLSKTEEEKMEDEIRRLQLELDKSKLNAHRAYGEALRENRDLKKQLSNYLVVNDPSPTHR
jgi:hypothetical protein